MNTSEVLYRAADHIQQFGHAKYALGSQGEPTCALGAIQVAAGVVGANWLDAGGRFLSYLGLDFVADWNNAPERTAAEVIEALRSAAVIEAARESEAARVSA